MLGWVLAAATAETGTRGGLLTRWIHCTPAQPDSTKHTPTAAMPMAEVPFSGRRLPMSRMITNEAAMMAGMIQTCVSMKGSVTCRDQPFMRSTSSTSMLWRLR